MSPTPTLTPRLKLANNWSREAILVRLLLAWRKSPLPVDQPIALMAPIAAVMVKSIRKLAGLLIFRLRSPETVMGPAAAAAGLMADMSMTAIILPVEVKFGMAL